MEHAPGSLPAINKPESLKESAYRVIKEAILTFRFKPGQALSHRELATQLKISETPIRDALQELEREGFVVRIAYKGTFVTEIDPADIEETFQIRGALDVLAVRLAVSKLTRDDIQEMDRLLAAAAAALKAGNREKCSQYGAEFHNLFVLKAGNRRLQSITNNLDDHSTRFRRISDRIHGRLEKSQGEHRRVLEAARRGDAEGAAQAMREHLQSVVQDMKISDQDWEDVLP